MLRVLLTFLFPCLIITAAAVVSPPESADESRNDSFRTARHEDFSTFLHCLSQEYAEMANCFGIKALTVLDRASRMNHIDVFPGVTIAADLEEIQQRSARALKTEQEIENTISADPSEKATKLMTMLFDSLNTFIQTHALQLRMPSTTSDDLQRALDEGRVKIKKKFWPYLAIIAMKIFALLPLVLGFIGFLALKALFVGKIAFIIAAILAFQKYSYGGFSGFGKQTDGYSNSASSYSTISSPGGGYYKRSMEDQAANQYLAFSAQSPQQISQS